MKIADVVNQIRAVFPKHTSLASGVMNITAISVSGGVATFTTGISTGFNGGESVTIANVNFKNDINSVSQDGLVFTFTTTVDHDLTFDYQDQVTFEGFTDSAWNDSFSLVAVPNRRTFKVKSSNIIPTLNGNEKLLEPRNDGVNGRYLATPITDTSFSVSGNFLDGDYVGGTISGDVRVAGSVEIERALSDYTEMGSEELWLFVTPHDAEVSKDRSTFSDGTATRAAGEDMRTRIVDGFNVFIVQTITEQIAGLSALDTARHDMLLPMMKSVYGTRFDTGLSGGPDFRTVLTGHGVTLYNKAQLVYVYEFEVTTDLTNDDAVDNEDNRAFRDIDSTLNIGVEEMTVNVNLDEEPLS